MSKSKLGVVGLGLMGLGSTLFATPAQAATSCGTAPTGATLLRGNDFCQLTFTGGGSYFVTVPSSATDLYAILVGAGSGAVVQTTNHIAYSGTGGHVRYVNLTSQVGTPLQFNIDVGTAGSSTPDVAMPAPVGGVSMVVYSSQVVSTTGSSTDYNTGCTIPSYAGGEYPAMFLGLDAANSARTLGGQSCTDSQGLGINPSAGNPDSEGNPVPAIFANYNSNLGQAGQIAIDASPTASGFGGGGSLRVSSTDLSTSNIGAGKDGAAILRWRSGALANTGSNSDQLAGWAAGLVAAGITLFVASRARRRKQ